jgi:hypothetical protein
LCCQVVAIRQPDKHHRIYQRGRWTTTKIMRLFSLGCHLKLMHMGNCRTITDGADFKVR